MPTEAEMARDAWRPLWQELRPGDVVLLKASRALHLETVTDEIAAHLVSLIPSEPRPDLTERLSFFERHRALSLHAGDARVTLRPPFRQESPVTGTRFD